MSDLAELFTAAFARLAELERKIDGNVMSGTVASVDSKAGTVRLKLGTDDEGKDFLSPSIPYAQSMGALKVHSPPSVGQQMKAFAAAGDFRQGLAISHTQSDANKSPSEKGDEHVVEFGQAKIELRGGEIFVTVPKIKFTVAGVVFDFSGDGLKVTGGRVEHDGKNIGRDHTHGGILPGGSNTDVPNA